MEKLEGFPNECSGWEDDDAGPMFRYWNEKLGIKC